MEASVAMKAMDKDRIRNQGDIVSGPFNGKDYIPLKKTVQDAVDSATRWETKNGKGESHDLWHILTCHWTPEHALRLYNTDEMIRDTACIAPGYKMQTIDLNQTHHTWQTQVTEDFIRVNLSDCTTIIDTCPQCFKTDRVYSRMNSWFYCPLCWQIYWSEQNSASSDS